MVKTANLNVKDKIPSFNLTDQAGNLFNSDELFESPAIIYFYPKDDTPGCTKEACSFRDSLERFKDLEVRVVGISPDSVESHKGFTEKYGLNFTLLADEDHRVSEMFGTWQEGKMVRTTFLVDGEGVIRWIERPVKVDGHIERLMYAVREFTNLEPME